MFGYKIGLNNDNIYVAVPKKYFDDPQYEGVVLISCDGKTKEVVAKEREHEATFDDKYNKGMVYTLYYFKWSD